MLRALFVVLALVVATPAVADTDRLTPISDRFVLSGDQRPDGSCPYQIESSGRVDVPDLFGLDLQGSFEVIKTATLAPGEVRLVEDLPNEPSFVTIWCNPQDGIVFVFPDGIGGFTQVGPYHTSR